MPVSVFVSVSVSVCVCVSNSLSLFLIHLMGGTWVTQIKQIMSNEKTEWLEGIPSVLRKIDKVCRGRPLEKDRAARGSPQCKT